MVTFLKRTILFMFIFLSLIVLIVIGTSILERKTIDFQLQQKPNYIVVGHSHSECAYNDSLIPNLKNLSQSGDSYLYSYIKTKQIIKHNPSVNVIFIEFTNNQIERDIEEWIWSDKFITYKYPMYASFTSINENLLLFKHNPKAYTKGLGLSLKMKSTRFFKNDADYLNQLGGYLYLERDKTDSILNADVGSNNKPTVISKGISEINLSYLDALIKFCKANEKRVVLIRSPQHEKYNEYQNEKTYQELLNTRYATVEYLDFSNFPLSNSEFGDLQHLNHKGAKVFSEWFATLLENGLLEKRNKQDYIDENMNQHLKN
ncbi:hypothetical protein [Winogradskyella schleiferi]|uniref:hypothetical protein n=1 Tax=Winogradskyella schleiferi TaxID=2686078 RepID=UPI0015BAA8B7|nr:hypothetical protein [Winogradskyella schleiferi]